MKQHPCSEGGEDKTETNNISCKKFKRATPVYMSQTKENIKQ